MNHWAAWLRDLPPILQGAIARSQRISLPRGCDAETRLARMRAALCHARTVRETYFGLAAPERAAIQDLRARPRGLSRAELEARYGPLRAPSALRADPRPQSVSERLLLLGWLLPRPATPRHPARYVVPPEVRAWLPRPLTLRDHGPAPAPGLPPALRVATALLLTCAERPLALRADGTLRSEALRLIHQRLAPLDQATVTAVSRLAVPLLAELGLVTARDSVALLPRGQRWLDHDPGARLAELQAAWLRSPRPDAWLLPLLADTRALDWPVLRLRLVGWTAALPASRLLDPVELFDALAAALGPLADPYTHAFGTAGRTPWSSARMRAVWDAALRGPLTWLGLIAWAPSELPGAEACFRATAALADGGGEAPAPEGLAGAGLPSPAEPGAPWRYGAPGEVVVPHEAPCATLVRLLPFLAWQRADALSLTYRVEPRQLARSHARGLSSETLHALLGREAGPAPAGWWPASTPPAPLVRIVGGAVVVADPPAALDRALEHRNVRRYVAAHLAPGVALVEPGRIPALTRALERAHLVVRGEGQAAAAPAPLSVPECAALLEACAFYRRHGPAGSAPALEALEDRLRAALPPDQQLRAGAYSLAPADALPAAPDLSAWLPVIRRAIRHRRTLSISYTAASGAPSERRIRPLRLERHGEHWYLYAYCLARQDERCFRLDRVAALAIDGGRGRRGDPEARAAALAAAHGVSDG